MEFVKSEIAMLREQGIVEDASSDTAWTTPIVLVKKADSGWHLCTNFRKLNSVTEPDPFYSVGLMICSIGWERPSN